MFTGPFFRWRVAYLLHHYCSALRTVKNTMRKEECDWSSDNWVALRRVVFQCVRGSARSHNNRLIEVIIWQPRIALNEERTEVVVHQQRRVRCEVPVCGAEVFLLCFINLTNSHACRDLWVNTELQRSWSASHDAACSARWLICYSSAKGEVFFIYFRTNLLKKAKICTLKMCTLFDIKLLKS